MTKLSLIFDAPPPRKVALALARAEGERAGRRAADRAERMTDGFREAAAAFILGYLAQHGVSSGELITDACKLAGIRAPDDRAMGPVYAALLRAGRIKIVGTTTRRKGHGCRGANLFSLAESDA